MTLLVVHQNVCYVDSRVVVGDARRLSSKVTRLDDVIYASAGFAEVANQAMFELKQKGNWFDVVETVSEDPEYTFVVARIEGQLYFLDLHLAKPRLVPVVKPDQHGLQIMAGSGWRWFHAYFLEHQDLDKAFELTAKYCRYVAAPIETF